MGRGEDLETAVRVAVGQTLGLFRVIGEHGAIGPAELAARAAVNADYTRGWLTAMATSGRLDYDAATDEFRLPVGRSPGVEEDENLVTVIGPDELPACAPGPIDGLLAALPLRPQHARRTVVRYLT